jgi:hypothetical protein
MVSQLHIVMTKAMDNAGRKALLIVDSPVEGKNGVPAWVAARAW